MLIVDRHCAGKCVRCRNTLDRKRAAISLITMAVQGILHSYVPDLVAFEFTDQKTPPAPNVLVFIGGLSDGLLTVPYLQQLANGLETVNSTLGNWCLVQTLISSSYNGWTSGSLERDVKELKKLVQYLRSEAGGSRRKIVLMGHLTGCQDTMEYLTKICSHEEVSEDSILDGAILQAPVSDREAMEMFKGTQVTQELIEECKRDFLEKGRQNEMLPPKFSFFDTQLTAYRFHSLAAPGGDDDYFSSDLTYEDHRKTFGIVNTPLLVLYGAKDECVPKSVDREALVKLWEASTNPYYWSPLSKVLQGATHNVGPGSDPGAVDDLVATVTKFVESLH